MRPRWAQRLGRLLWRADTACWTLGLWRILYFGWLLGYALSRDLLAWGAVPAVLWEPVGVFRLLSLPPPSMETLAPLQLLWRIALVLSALGLFTRASTVVSLVAGWYLLGLPQSFGKIIPTDLIHHFVLVFFALSRAGDCLSLDALRRRGRAQAGGTTTLPHLHTRSGHYGWPIRLVWVTMATIFFCAGVSKLQSSGLSWIFSLPDTFLFLGYRYPHQPASPLLLSLATHPRWCAGLGILTLGCELGFPLALWFRRARWVVVPGMLLLQLGIQLLLHLDFLPLIVCYAFWLPLERLQRPAQASR